jgi:sugar phosphate isomerase/epimerase
MPAPAGQFELGLNIDNIPLKPPAQLAPGFDFSEIPITELLLPYNNENTFRAMLAEMKSWGIPPIKAASHFLHHEMITGPAVDFSVLEKLAEVTIRRLSEAGVAMAGIWGYYFALPEGFPRQTAEDQAIKYCHMLAKLCDKYNVNIALENMAGKNTLFPSYKQALELAKKVNHPRIKVMADLNYFVELNEPLSNILIDPSYCIHVHIQGDKYQPNVGSRGPLHLELFRILRDVKYTLGVSAAQPWTISEGNIFNWRAESAKTLRYMQDLRAKVYAEK